MFGLGFWCCCFVSLFSVHLIFNLVWSLMKLFPMTQVSWWKEDISQERRWVLYWVLHQLYHRTWIMVFKSQDTTLLCCPFKVYFNFYLYLTKIKLHLSMFGSNSFVIWITYLQQTRPFNRVLAPIILPKWPILIFSIM